ncbi:hypothetical protein V1525DRAFT_368464 [Lipomyces kononenkoae]|uniref:Uncharacterized protein n=1 Tax=Lipomyces kononenkoae TaxID=34357 RepID=A0ACC3TC54_LIPKO
MSRNGSIPSSPSHFKSTVRNSLPGTPMQRSPMIRLDSASRIPTPTATDSSQEGTGERRRSGIVIHWSDGDPSTFPSGELLNPRTKADGTRNYFRKLSRDDPRHISYLQSIAQLMIEFEISQRNDLSAIPKGTPITLRSMPKGYAIFDHCTNKHPGSAINSHDTYIFGHPSGRKFRHPYEFVPHAIWMATNRDHDRSQCTCELCSVKSMGLQRSHLVRLSRRKMTAAQIMKEATRLLADAERTEDAKIGGPWYRIGEVVRHRLRRQGHGDYWEPALINKRPSLYDNEPIVDAREQETREKEGYALYLYESKSTLLDVPEDEILPWLAMPQTCAIEKVMEIVQSWSVFDKDRVTPECTEYNGIFWGAEKIWVGEALRIKPDPGTESERPGEEILVIDKIMVTTGGKLAITGDLYVSALVAVQPKNPPPRVCAERNWKMLNTLEDAIEIDGTEISGRWYASTVCASDTLHESIVNVENRVSCRMDVAGTDKHIRENSPAELRTTRDDRDSGQRLSELEKKLKRRKVDVADIYT